MIDRYSLSKMSRIWSDEHKMEIMLKIEVLSCEAMTKLGAIPKATQFGGLLSTHLSAAINLHS